MKYLSLDLGRLKNSDTWAEAHKHPWMGLACHNLWYAAAERDGEGLPNDDETLSRLAGVSLKVWKSLRPKVMKSWTLVDGRWVHPIVQAEAERYKKSVENGRKGAKAKHNKNNDLPSPPTSPPGGNPTRPPNGVATSPPAGTPLPIVQSSQVKSSSKEVSSASAPELPLDRLLRLLKIDHRTLLRKPSFQGFAGFLYDWKAAGCDLERDVWPTIERVAARGQDIGSPKFFEKAIFKARDDRIAAEPSEAERWATRVEGFKVGGFWPDAYGPRPGQPGCLCPPELLIGIAA